MGVLRALEPCCSPTPPPPPTLSSPSSSLIRVRPSLGAESQKELLSAALAALHAAAVLPYHLVAPHRRAVVTALNTSLDHPKRRCACDAAR